jgi:hypothetical protein
LSHPPYSPELSPCDFWLFPVIKQRLRRKTFTGIGELLAAWNEELGKLGKEDFNHAFSLWFDRCKLCLQNNGEYFE